MVETCFVRARAHTANALLIGLNLHIVGASKHHIIDKDNTLTRILGKKQAVKSLI